MDFNILNNIQPYVRWVKIEKKDFLSGNWIDYDNSFTFIASGSAIFIINGERYTVKSGDVVILTPGLQHIIRSDKNHKFRQYILHFDLFKHNEDNYPYNNCGFIKNRLRIVSKEEMSLKEFPSVIRLDEYTANEIRRIFLIMHKEYNEKRTGYQGMMQGMLLEMLCYTYRSLTEADKSIKENSIKSWSSIQQIIEIIHLQYADANLSIGKIAEIIGFTPNYLSNLFKKNLGITIYDYLTFVRIDAGKQFLYQSGLNISQIAEKCGFSSIYSFSRAFRRETKKSPSQYAHNISIPTTQTRYYDSHI